MLDPAPGSEIAAPPPRLDLFYRGEAALFVPEYAEVELRLTNPGPPLKGLGLWRGGELLRREIYLAGGGVFSLPLAVGDLLGEQVLTVKDEISGRALASATLNVQPRRLSPAEVDWIRLERLPALLARLDAPNALRLRYDDAESAPLFDFVSADYTAQRLRYFCRQLLDEDLAGRIAGRLDFASPARPRRESGFVPGGVRWPETVREWLNRPEETGLVHRRVETPRDYATLPNLLFLYCLRTLSEENRRLVRLVRGGLPASPRLKAALAEFEGYALALDNALELHRAAFRPLPGVLEQAGFEPLEEAALAECENAPNPAYAQLAGLWRVFRRRYARLPDGTGRDYRAGLQPAARLYEWWAACEIAAALGLTFEGDPGLESATFRGPEGVLYYNLGLPGGWYSASRAQPPRPDLRLERPGFPLVLLDVKYRVASGQPKRAHPDDMYRMLAYLNDFQAAAGAIIFPGEVAEDRLKPGLQVVEKPGGGPVQRLAELALRPPVDTAKVEDWQTSLRRNLERLMDF